MAAVVTAAMLGSKESNANDTISRMQKVANDADARIRAIVRDLSTDHLRPGLRHRGEPREIAEPQRAPQAIARSAGVRARRRV